MRPRTFLRYLNICSIYIVLSKTMEGITRQGLLWLFFIWVWILICQRRLDSMEPDICANTLGQSLAFYFMMTSSNGKIYRITGHLCGEFTSHRWFPRTRASDAEIWCFLWSGLIKRLSKHCDVVICDVIIPIMSVMLTIHWSSIWANLWNVKCDIYWLWCDKFQSRT